MKSFALILVLIGAMSAASAVRGDEIASQRGIKFFEKSVRPLLVKYCFECHSNRAKAPKGGLRLDSRLRALKGGESGAALIPGQPEKSLMIKAVRWQSFEMPPKKKLSTQQIATLVKWIELGAPWSVKRASKPAEPKSIGPQSATTHWSFQPVNEPPVPTARHSSWPRNAVDQFVLSRLELEGLSPSKRATDSTLIRRLTFDLIGLPPKVREVERFVRDRSLDKYERLVDRLLASPHHGERWGRYWLDLARYADSNGADINYTHANAWRYRDYVIRQFNRDTPYDQFLTEQLAGDLIDSPANESEQHDRLTATGFLMLGPKMLSEVDTDKLLVDVVDEQMDVVGKTFLGMTFGCARCHDHKFDPITTRDYYGLAGIFRSTKTFAKLRVVLTKVSEWQERELHSASIEREIARVDYEVARVEKQIISLGAGLEPRKTSSPADARRAIVVTDLPLTSSTTWAAWVRLHDGDKPNLDAVISATHAGADQGHSLGFYSGSEALHPRVVWNHGPGRKHTIIRSRDAITVGKWHHIVATFDSEESALCLFVNGEQKAKATSVSGTSFESINIGRREASTRFPYRGDVDDVMVFTRVLDPVEIRSLAQGKPPNPRGLLLRWDFESFDGADVVDVSGNKHHGRLVGNKSASSARTNRIDGRAFSFAAAAPNSVTSTANTNKVSLLRAQLVQLKKSRPVFPRVMAVSSGEPVDLPIHIRGSHLNLADDPVRRGTPQVFDKYVDSPIIKPAENGRLTLARWMTDPRHPLTARVMVNRIWQGHFGHGLVRTPSNFGLRGEHPSHPNLLDWLAVRFIESRWSVKAIHRLILTSATYQQRSLANPNSPDPDNRLLRRQNTRRLEAEAIRDSLLFVAGNLEQGMGGSVMQEANFKRVTLTPESDVYKSHRRAIYLPVVRVRGYGMFSVFDFQPTGQHIARRSTTVVPQQALFMMNSSLVSEQASRLAETVLESSETVEHRLDKLYRRLFARLPTPKERTLAHSNLKRLRQLLKTMHGIEVTEQAIWGHLCHLLLASNEFIYLK